MEMCILCRHRFLDLLTHPLWVVSLQEFHKVLDNSNNHPPQNYPSPAAVSWALYEDVFAVDAADTCQNC